MLASCFVLAYCPGGNISCKRERYQIFFYSKLQILYRRTTSWNEHSIFYKVNPPHQTDCFCASFAGKCFFNRDIFRIFDLRSTQIAYRLHVDCAFCGMHKLCIFKWFKYLAYASNCQAYDRKQTLWSVIKIPWAVHQNLNCEKLCWDIYVDLAIDENGILWLHGVPIYAPTVFSD